MSTLSPQQTLVLGRLTGLLARRGFVLGGGCAVGLLLDHRRSLDLDFFCVADLDAAVAGRGARKDFVDLHGLCTGPISLSAALDAFDHRYATRGYDRYHLLRSLSYFHDAEQDPMPALTPPVPWEEIRGYFEERVPALLLGG